MSARVLTIVVGTCGECPECEPHTQEMDCGYCKLHKRWEVDLRDSPPDWCPLPKQEDLKR